MSKAVDISQLVPGYQYMFNINIFGYYIKTIYNYVFMGPVSRVSYNRDRMFSTATTSYIMKPVYTPVFVVALCGPTGGPCEICFIDHVWKVEQCDCKPMTSEQLQNYRNKQITGTHASGPLIQFESLESSLSRGISTKTTPELIIQKLQSVSPHSASTYYTLHGISPDRRCALACQLNKKFGKAEFYCKDINVIELVDNTISNAYTPWSATSSDISVEQVLDGLTDWSWYMAHRLLTSDPYFTVLDSQNNRINVKPGDRPENIRQPGLTVQPTGPMYFDPF